MSNPQSLPMPIRKKVSAPLSSPVVTRLAPSPTGELHLGNIWSFLLCWLAARASGGKIQLRMDDIDPQRSRQVYAERIMEILQWLGLDWDEGPVWQSQNYAFYEKSLENLKNRANIYPCFCSRHDLRALAAAPHIGDAGVTYPGTCARLAADEVTARLKSGKPWSLRLQCPEEAVAFDDLIQGPQSFSKNDYGGDFPLKRSDNIWSYQLASALDDMELGANLILRGRDLLPSTPRQIILYHLLEKQLPQFAHIPLLLDEQRERLAKRHKSLCIAELAANGAKATQIIGQLGKLAGCNPSGEPKFPGNMIRAFDLEHIPKKDIAISPAIVGGKFSLSIVNN